MREYTIKHWDIEEPLLVSEHIGNALKGILREKHMTQAELAKKIRKTPARVSRLINGKCGSNMESLIPVLDELGYEIVIRDKNHWLR